MKNHPVALVYKGLIAIVAVAFSGLAAAQMTPVGSWHSFDDKTGELKSLVVISEANGVLTGHIEQLLRKNADEVGAAAVDYLRVAGHMVFGYFWARMAQVALQQIAAGSTDPFYTAKLQTARFYFAKLFPETSTLMRTARTGVKVLMDTDAALA